MTEPTTATIPRLRIVLDIDETLVHTNRLSKGYEERDKFRLINIYGLKHGIIQFKSFFEHTKSFITETFQIVERPYVREFLNDILKIADIYLFTTGIKEYAYAIANYLDPSGVMFKAIYSRDNLCDWCFAKKHLQYTMENEYIPERTIFVDDMPLNHAIQPDNGILIPGFCYEEGYSSEYYRIVAKEDTELLKIRDFIINKLLYVEDVRPIIQIFYGKFLRERIQKYCPDWEKKRQYYLEIFDMNEKEWKEKQQKNRQYIENMIKECNSKII